MKFKRVWSFIMSMILLLTVSVPVNAKYIADYSQNRDNPTIVIQASIQGRTFSDTVMKFKSSYGGIRFDPIDENTTPDYTQLEMTTFIIAAGANTQRHSDSKIVEIGGYMGVGSSSYYSETDSITSLTGLYTVRVLGSNVTFNPPTLIIYPNS